MYQKYALKLKKKKSYQHKDTVNLVAKKSKL